MGSVLSIIIPTSGSVEFFAITLNGLMANKSAENFEYIIINEGGNRELSHFLKKKKERGYNIKEVVNNRKSGSYAARNQGLKKTNNEWVLFADDGLEIPEDWLEKAQRYFSYYDFIGCNIKFKKKNKESLGETYARIKGFKPETKFYSQGFGLTTFLFVNKKVFDKVGGFDGRLFSGGDLEFSQRVKKAGFHQKFLKELVVFHMPIGWYQQFLKMTRILKGRNDLAKFYPYQYGHLQLKWKDLLRTLKYLFDKLLSYKKTEFFQSGEVTWLKHQIGQIVYFSIYFTAQLLVFILPWKRFNW